MPQLDFSYYFSQIFWLFISFGVLMTIISGIVIPNLARVLNERRVLLSELQQRANSLQEKINLLEEDYKSGKKAIAAEVRKVIANSVEDMEAKKAQRLADLSKRIQGMLLSAESKMLQYAEDSKDERLSLIADLMALYLSKLAVRFPLLSRLEGEGVRTAVEEFIDSGGFASELENLKNRLSG